MKITDLKLEVHNMKYKLIGDNDYIFDPQGQILANRGIDDIDTFLHLTDDVTHDYRLLKNIDVAVESLLKHIKNNSKIVLIVDPDVDGYSSGSILYQRIKLIDDNANLIFIVRNDKKHGLEGINLPDDANLILVPDGGSNDFKYHKDLHKKGIDILVLDHHEIEKESEHAIIVNTRLGYPNLNLSGAGVVYKFCKALDDELGIDYADEFLDLVAVGNIGDSMSMKELETRYYVNQGIENINNEFLQALVRKQDYSINGKVNITSINYYINPLINAVVRVGTLEDKIDMFKSFTGEKELVKYKPRGGDETLVPLVDDMARRCTNIKAKQGRMVDKIMPLIDESIEKNGLHNNNAIIVHDVKDIDKGLTGLICNKVASKHKKPVIILSGFDKDNINKGSARGYDKGELKDFKEVVLQSDLFDFAAGHASAFGCGIHIDNINHANDKLNDLLREYNFEDVFEVDFDIPATSLSEDLVYEINDMEDIWGKGIEEPLMLIRDINIKDAEVNLMGKKENTVGIVSGEIKYILFNTDRDTYEMIANAKTVNVVGKAKINRYKGEDQPQITIEAIETF